jgi:hypothetical protein
MPSELFYYEPSFVRMLLVSLRPTGISHTHPGLLCLSRLSLPLSLSRLLSLPSLLFQFDPRESRFCRTISLVVRHLSEGSYILYTYPAFIFSVLKLRGKPFQFDIIHGEFVYMSIGTKFKLVHGAIKFSCLI